MEIKEIINLLKLGKIGVIPTDTIYGIVGSALKPEVVEQIYQLRKRSKDKPMIILISSLEDLNQFNIKLTNQQREFLEKNWPNPLSVVLPCDGKQFIYLHRGTNSLAFRMPNNKKLLDIIKNTGPLVAPSANFEGQKPAKNIEEAKKYFGENVSFYLDEGTTDGNSSTLVRFENNALEILRQGSFKVVT